jgi:hypothetical protein
MYYNFFDFARLELVVWFVCDLKARSGCDVKALKSGPPHLCTEQFLFKQLKALELLFFFAEFNGYVLMGVLHLIVPSDYLFITDKSFNFHVKFITCYPI